MRGSVVASWSGFLVAGVFVVGGTLAGGQPVPLSDGVVTRAGDFVYVSGVIGNVPGSSDLREGIAAQVHQAIQNVQSALQAEGLDLSDVVSSNVYLSDTRNFQAMNEIYRTYFSEDPPTRATVEADLPDAGALIQLTMVATRPELGRRVIAPSGMQVPGLPYSWGILAGNTLFIAGATSRDPATYEPVTGDVATQTRRVMRNIGNVLEAAGMEYGDIIGCKVFLADGRDFRTMSQAYASFLPTPRPVRATVRARLMNPVFAVEVQCFAVKDPNNARTVPGGGPGATGALSPALQVGNRLFLSGMLGRGPDGYAPGDFETQTRQALDNISGALQSGGMSFANVVDVAVWITDIRQANRVGSIVREALPDRPVTIVGSGLMSTAGLVEIQMTAER